MKKFLCLLFLLLTIGLPVFGEELQLPPLNEAIYVDIVAKQIRIVGDYGYRPVYEIRYFINHLHKTYQVTNNQLYAFGIYYKKHPKASYELDKKIKKKLFDLNQEGWTAETMFK